MPSPLVFLVTLFCLVLHRVTLVNAALYVVQPFQGTTCHGGEPCTVTWLDDGRTPLVEAVGLVDVGLYTGDEQLVQRLPHVDVSTSSTMTFVPNPAAGPTSDGYYISFTSTSLLVNDTKPYRAYSPWFRLDRMTGSFDRPLSSAISSIPVPSSLVSRDTSSTTVLSTRTVGVSTRAPSPSVTPPAAPPSSSSVASPSPSSASVPASPLPSSSGFITSRAPSASASPSSTGSSSTPSSSPSLPSSPRDDEEDNQEEDDDDSSAFRTTSGSVGLSVLACLTTLLFFA